MSAPEDKSLTFFDLIILLLSGALLTSLLVTSIVEVPPEANRLLQWFDTIVCLFFGLDFALRFQRAKNKVQFMKWGWIDLIASIPNVDFLRIGRLARVLRIIQVIRGVRAIHRLTYLFLRRRFQNTVVSVLVTVTLLTIFSSTAILMVEAGPNANIQTASDAVWWSVTTITTVGYGDRYPVTTEGRIIASILMCAGVGLFGTLSGIIASYFLGKQEAADPDHAQLSAVLHRLERIEKLLEQSTQQQGGEQPTVDSTRNRSPGTNSGSLH